jgi:hypothetical protein
MQAFTAYKMGEYPSALLKYGMVIEHQIFISPRKLSFSNKLDTVSQEY